MRREDVLESFDDRRHAAGRGHAEAHRTRRRLAYVGLRDLHRDQARGVLVRPIDAAADKEHGILDQESARAGVGLGEHHDLDSAVEILERDDRPE